MRSPKRDPHLYYMLAVLAALLALSSLLSCSQPPAAPTEALDGRWRPDTPQLGSWDAVGPVELRNRQLSFTQPDGRRLHIQAEGRLFQLTARAADRITVREGK